ncbi:MAG: Ryanodine receptor Ryr [Ruminococcaceae bacterium]|nr:Ryanodine receptor Ryr [Oscillospiraceae bacterium]
MYEPKPMDTSDVQLPESLTELTERIAENVHEVWAASRISEGWTLGPERNTEQKTTPCLVPYAELPEEEKAYDRNTAMQTLKLIVKLGYRILPPEE